MNLTTTITRIKDCLLVAVFSLNLIVTCKPHDPDCFLLNVEELGVKSV